MAKPATSSIPPEQSATSSFARELEKLVRDTAAEAVKAALGDERRAGMARELRAMAERVERGDFPRVETRRRGLAALGRVQELNEREGIAEPTPEAAIEEVRELRARR